MSLARRELSIDPLVTNSTHDKYAVSPTPCRPNRPN